MYVSECDFIYLARKAKKAQYSKARATVKRNQKEAKRKEKTKDTQATRREGGGLGEMTYQISAPRS
jgi:hypothetical protein